MAKRHLIWWVSLLLSACVPAASSAPVIQPEIPTSTLQPAKPKVTESVQTEIVLPPTPSLAAGAQANPMNRRVDDPNQYSFPQLLPFDGILPVYNPEFSPAESASLDEDELVMGIALNGLAKAYPVSVLQFREMVDDELAGWPILVTW